MTCPHHPPVVLVCDYPLPAAHLEAMAAEWDRAVTDGRGIILAAGVHLELLTCPRCRGGKLGFHPWGWVADGAA